MYEDEAQTMSYTDVLNRLDEAGDEELSTARDEITTRMEELRPSIEAGTVSQAELEEIEQLGSAHGQITGQITTRTEAASERTDRARAALHLVSGGDGEEGEGGEDGDEPELQPAANPDSQPAHTAPGQPGAPPAPRAEDEVEPVAAAARPPLGAVTRTQPRQTRRQVQRAALTAAADVPGVAAGAPLNRRELAKAFSERWRALSRAKGGDGELVQVATFTAPEAAAERRLRRGDIVGNSARIEAQDALVAAGGLCAPFTPDYNIDVVGSLGRPVRDGLAGYQADRGGIYFRPDIDGAALSPTASGVWTNENDAAVGSGDDPDPKPHAVVDCPAMIQAQVEAETFQIEFSNVTTRFDPEATTAMVDALMIAHDRWSENRLLTKLRAGSTTISYDLRLGATRDVLAMLDQILAYYRSLHRLNDDVPLRIILPQWVKNLFRVDLMRALHNSNMDYFSVPAQKILQWFSDRSVTPTFHMDGQTTDTAASGGAPAVAKQQYGPKLAANAIVPGFPNQIDALIFQESKWIYLDGGSLDLGIVRDSGLVELNRYRMFSEEWGNPVHRGVESLRVVATVQPNGASSGTVTPNFTD